MSVNERLGSEDKRIAEWEAWKDVVVPEFRAAVGDINARRYNHLVYAIQRWGEFLVALRETQSALVRAEAMLDNDRRYQGAKAEVLG